jgi:hypothetical protein
VKIVGHPKEIQLILGLSKELQVKIEGFKLNSST